MWGFWQDSHWRENCYIVNSDWSLNAAGHRYEALMNEWTTDDSAVTDDNGNADFRGFYGTYAVVLTPADGNSEVHTI
jgi:endo-1,4-beta-xylanase